MQTQEEDHLKRKRNHGDGDEKQSGVRLGRGIRKVVDLYTNVDQLVHAADQYDANNDEQNEDDRVTEGQLAALVQDRHEHKRAKASVAVLPKLIPNFWAFIDNAGTLPDDLIKWYSELQRGANDARSDDVNRLKSAVAQWLNSEFSPPPNPLLSSDDRLHRGIQHDLVRAKIRNFEEGYELGTSARCLYQDYRGNPLDLEDGFLRSPLLVKTYLHIFTSPTSAKDVKAQRDDATGEEDLDSIAPPATYRRTLKTGCARKHIRKDVASTLNMGNKVTSRSIAYAAVQLLFALSSAPQWTTAHQGLDFRECYYYIVDFFDDVDDDPESAKHVQNLLKWWNKQIFPAAAPSGAIGTSKTRQKLAAQCAARKNTAPA
ncbi:hypothetical protein BDQ12DRAFT_728087 [Crucibulum laeve]|uniref:Fungal-type protein kinase domain-containing protein n=1 Tax=Crucibulum laeve TaxID=68775 RepID=A0A5C3LIY5_9AGAR|nr:hypothetical protein BDQ12DRAFT_728087 [Crucibulum laeve]